MPSVVRGSDNFDSGHDLGVGQTWQDVTASRASGVTYTNSTGKPIMVVLTVNTASDISVQGVHITSVVTGQNQMCVIVPNGATYSNTGGFLTWKELR